MKKYMGWIIVGAVVLVLFVGYQVANGVRNEAVTWEKSLNAQYRDNQNILSAFISSYKETLGIADRATEQLDRVMEDAIKGRYENGGVSMGNGQLVNALAEAYPDLSAIPGAYDRVFDVIQSGRAEYKGAQTKLLDMIRGYDTFRRTDFIKSAILSGSFPSQDLEARLGNQVFRGRDALDRMNAIVLTADATSAYEKGEMEPMAPPALPPKQ